MTMTRFTPFLLLGLLLLLPLTGCESPDDARADTARTAAAVPVETAPVVVEERALPIRTSGRLAKKAEITLSFKIGGFVDAIRADEGDRVRAGQVLARLDLDEINAEVKRARSSLEQAQRDLRRATALYRDSVATLEEKQNAETAVEVAEAALEAATFNQQHATIVAPAAGRIQQRRVDEHEQVSAGTPVFEFGAETDGWVMRVGLADKDVVNLRLGSPARVRFDAYPETVFDAQVTEIADAAHPVSGTFEVELQIDDPEQRLKSGLIGSADLRPIDTERYVFIPTSALVEGNGRRGIVYGLESASTDAGGTRHRVRRMPVHIERMLGSEVALRSDIDSIEQVVTRGGAYLHDGSWVTVSSSQAVAQAGL